MRTYINLFAAIALLFTFTACKSTPKRIAYNSLATTAQAVDLAMSTAGELYKVQRITEADKSDILAKYAKYQLAMNEAIVLLQFDYTAITPAKVAELAASIVETVNQFTSAP
jgi:hypothetical protein